MVRDIPVKALGVFGETEDDSDLFWSVDSLFFRVENLQLSRSRQYTQCIAITEESFPSFHVEILRDTCDGT